MNIYDIIVKDAKGNDVPMAEYKDKVLLIVNTATQCGFTPQYKGLQELYDKYNSKGFEILDFPCNQFMNQSPLAEDEIQSFCEMKYHTTFRLFEKVDVNGENTSPLFKYLKEQKGGLFTADIKWNFSKFLISRDGVVVKRYTPMTQPAAIEKDIISLL